MSVPSNDGIVVVCSASCNVIDIQMPWHIQVRGEALTGASLPVPFPTTRSIIPYARKRPRTIRTRAPNVLSVAILAAAAVEIALALALVLLAPTVARVAEVMVALDSTDWRVVVVIGVGSTGTGNEPVLLPIMPLLIMLALIIVSPLMVAPDNVAVVDMVATLDIIETVDVVPSVAEGVGPLVVVPRIAEGVGMIVVVVPGPTTPVSVGSVVTADTAPIAPHEAEAHSVQLCTVR
ncbi:hypothetical protein MMC27_000031 [Xylographa pallens]|nr:hypothetical protein [Xylographa pallens]